MSALYTQAAAIICLKYHQPHVDTRHKNKIYIKAKNACHRTRTFFKKYTVCSLLLVTTSTLFHELTNPWAWNSQLDVKCITELSSYHLCPSVLWRCWLGGRKGIRPVKNWVVGCWRGYLGWDADLHIAQQMPLPLTISCSSKSRLVLPSWFLPSWYLLTRVVPDKFQKNRKTVVCVCVCVCGQTGLVSLGRQPV